MCSLPTIRATNQITCYPVELIDIINCLCKKRSLLDVLEVSLAGTPNERCGALCGLCKPPPPLPPPPPPSPPPTPRGAAAESRGSSSSSSLFSWIKTLTFYSKKQKKLETRWKKKVAVCVKVRIRESKRIVEENSEKAIGERSKSFDEKVQSPTGCAR